MDQRSLMEGFNGHRTTLYRIRPIFDRLGSVTQCRVAASESIIRGQCDKRAGMFSTFTQEVIRHSLGERDWIDFAKSVSVNFTQALFTTHARNNAFKLVWLKQIHGGSHQM